MAYRGCHVLMLPTLIPPEHLLAFLNSHVLQEVCVAFALRTLKAKLAEEGHHLHNIASL